MFAPFADRLPHRKVYIRKQLKYLLVAVGLILVSLVIGIAGYMAFGHLAFTDAFLNASMILGGMGPVDTMQGTAAKWFSAFYALYSGVALLTIVAAMLTPTIHRLIHKLHLDQRDRMTKAAEKPKE
jgi:flagellar biosynthesis protein FliR